VTVGPQLVVSLLGPNSNTHRSWRLGRLWAGSWAVQGAVGKLLPSVRLGLVPSSVSLPSRCWESGPPPPRPFGPTDTEGSPIPHPPRAVEGGSDADGRYKTESGAFVCGPSPEAAEAGKLGREVPPCIAYAVPDLSPVPVFRSSPSNRAKRCLHAKDFRPHVDS
jgi:hypothetical protein